MKLWKDRHGVPKGITFRALSTYSNPVMVQLTFKDLLRFLEQLKDYNVYLNEAKGGK